MKTPMMELIEQLKAIHDCRAIVSIEASLPIHTVVMLAESLLEKEKEAMCEFAERYLDSIPKEHPSVEDVYNETFNTKEK